MGCRRELRPSSSAGLVPVARRVETLVSYEIDPVFGCWLSTNRLDRDGYAYHGSSRAHIVAWERAHGPVPDHLELDHVCRRRHCVWLHHIEAVTKNENSKRKQWKYRAKRTACPQGHPYEVNRIVTPEGGLACRQCRREAGA